jgi:sugar phosphate isomerase/epimerase
VSTGCGDPRLARLSLNQRTIPRWSLPEVVDGCAWAGIRSVGLWREPVAEYGLARTAQLVQDADLRVSSLCRGGFFTNPDPLEWKAAIEENLRALDETAALRAECLVLVVGGLLPGSTDLAGARKRVLEALHLLAPAARERGVRLALEPMHPMFCADRAVVSTLRQAVQLAEAVEPDPGAEPSVGVVVDAYHVWWDPDIWRAITLAGPRILSFQVSDWVLPLAAEVLLARGMVGDGCIGLRELRAAVDEAGYSGDIEVEIFNQGIWDTDGDLVLATLAQRYLEHVL